MEEGEDNQLGGYEEEEYDEEGQVIKPGKKKKELSDAEKAKIKQTIEEMKRNQIQPQKIIGKKDFDKPGFVSNPSKIVYKDFEVGKKNVTDNRNNKRIICIQQFPSSAIR